MPEILSISGLSHIQDQKNKRSIAMGTMSLMLRRSSYHQKKQTATIISAVHSGKVRGQIWTFLKLMLEVRWVLKNWGKTEAFRCFFTECKSIEIWLRYKHFSDFPNSKIIAEMLKNLAAHHWCTFPFCNGDTIKTNRLESSMIQTSLTHEKVHVCSSKLQRKFCCSRTN